MTALSQPQDSRLVPHVAARLGMWYIYLAMMEDTFETKWRMSQLYM